MQNKNSNGFYAPPRYYIMLFCGITLIFAGFGATAFGTFFFIASVITLGIQMQFTG
jgi:hypothetical protein